MEVIVKPTYDEVSKLAAGMIAEFLRCKPRAVLGFATGSTPLGTYKELIRLHREEGLDFSQAVTFNLDEYIGLPKDNDQSYHYFMWENLFKHINVLEANVHIPDGMSEDLHRHCLEYEEEIFDHGGLDVQLLGIGSNGHIAFNEPGSSLGSRTRIKTLDEKTRQDNARFFKSIDEVPRYCLTMGIGTILEAEKLILLANGANKAEAVQKTVEGPITASVPASAIQLHPNATVIVDKAASGKLTRKYPGAPAMLDL
ncbi:MAG: glucosamine-6-phosphate deaminase [Candidatus Glassbacteria bacterium]|nr:glucosamine-6-phosphate deaminase [Candidatus Glassbacteria bacterium]